MGDRYKYYMKKYGTEDDTSVPTLDIEASYNGMIILQVSGLSSLGKPKNIYKETYAESSEVRVYIPENVADQYRRFFLHPFVQLLIFHLENIFHPLK